MTTQLRLRLDVLRQQLKKAREQKNFAEVVLLQKQINDVFVQVWNRSRSKKDSEQP